MSVKGVYIAELIDASQVSLRANTCCKSSNWHHQDTEILFLIGKCIQRYVRAEIDVIKCHSPYDQCILTQNFEKKYEFKTYYWEVMPYAFKPII